MACQSRGRGFKSRRARHYNTGSWGAPILAGAPLPALASRDRFNKNDLRRRVSYYVDNASTSRSLGLPPDDPTVALAMGGSGERVNRGNEGISRRGKRTGRRSTTPF